MANTEDGQPYIYVRDIKERGPFDQINARYKSHNSKGEKTAESKLGHLMQFSETEQSPTTMLHMSDTHAVGGT